MIDSSVANFLKRFHLSKDVDTVFTEGCCYWFAKILHDRYMHTRSVEIMYDEVINHFGTKIDGRVYDITGDVTDSYTWKPWSEVTDTLLRERIIRDCVDF